MSRDELGKKVEGGLMEYFQQKYGTVTSEGFQKVFFFSILHKTNKFFKARNNFIKSMAAYSVFSYVLQIKDRHNGNILIDEDGHVVHIGMIYYIK